MNIINNHFHQMLSNIIIQRSILSVMEFIMGYIIDNDMITGNKLELYTKYYNDHKSELSADPIEGDIFDIIVKGEQAIIALMSKCDEDMHFFGITISDLIPEIFSDLHHALSFTLSIYTEHIKIEMENIKSNPDEFSNKRQYNKVCKYLDNITGAEIRTIAEDKYTIDHYYKSFHQYIHDFLCEKLK